MPDDTLATGELALKDIHLPEPVSWWPPAPGWWLLACLLVVSVVIYIVLRKLKQRKRLRKQVLAEFEIIRARYLEDNNTYALVQSLSILLRRACISFYPRNNTASLTGEKWLDHLDQTAGVDSEKKEFKNKVGKILATAPYLPENRALDIDAAALLTLCESWLQAQPVKHLNTAGKQA